MNPSAPESDEREGATDDEPVEVGSQVGPEPPQQAVRGLRGHQAGRLDASSGAVERLRAVELAVAENPGLDPLVVRAGPWSGCPALHQAEDAAGEGIGVARREEVPVSPSR